MPKKEVIICLTYTHGFKIEGNQYKPITHDLNYKSNSNIAN